MHARMEGGRRVHRVAPRERVAMRPAPSSAYRIGPPSTDSSSPLWGASRQRSPIVHLKTAPFGLRTSGHGITGIAVGFQVGVWGASIGRVAKSLPGGDVSAPAHADFSLRPLCTCVGPTAALLGDAILHGGVRTHARCVLGAGGVQRRGPPTPSPHLAPRAQ